MVNVTLTGMSEPKLAEYLLHPVLGRLPARRVLDCVFALTPHGPILHHHIESMSVARESERVVYTLTDHAPAAEHARCRIIPPRVREFAP
jgi:hypothetical protein